MRRTPLLLIPIALLAVLSPVNAQEDQAPIPLAQESVVDSEAAVDAETVVDTGLQQALENYRWTLATAIDSEAQRIDVLFPETERPYTLTFTDSMLNFQGGCNSFSSSYEINAEGQLVAGGMQFTMMACAPELMAADTALATLLAQPLKIVLTTELEPQLQLQTAAHETLELQGEMLPEALYGPGTRIFLEIDARRLACRNPRNGETTCLQAREIVFDEQGLRVPPTGPWQPFYDTIEGYTHTPGVRNVLRVNRYKRGEARGNDAPFLYVLEMMVESETVIQ